MLVAPGIHPREDTISIKWISGFAQSRGCPRDINRMPRRGMHDESIDFMVFILSIHVKYAFLLLTYMSNPDTCINHNS